MYIKGAARLGYIILLYIIYIYIIYIIIFIYINLGLSP